jgi:hypothetical protein
LLPSEAFGKAPPTGRLSSPVVMKTLSPHNTGEECITGQGNLPIEIAPSTGYWIFAWADPAPIRPGETMSTLRTARSGETQNGKNTGA